MIKEIKNKVSNKGIEVYTKISTKLRDKSGFLEDGMGMLRAVVIGALLLAGIYLLFNETIMPTIKERIVDMFNYTV